MKIHLRQIPQGGTLHVEGDEDAGFLDLEEVGAQRVFAPRVSIRRGSLRWRSLCHRSSQCMFAPEMRGLSGRI